MSRLSSAVSNTGQFNLLLTPNKIYFRMNKFTVYYFSISTFNKCILKVLKLKSWTVPLFPDLKWVVLLLGGWMLPYRGLAKWSWCWPRHVLVQAASMWTLKHMPLAQRSEVPCIWRVTHTLFITLLAGLLMPMETESF